MSELDALEALRDVPVQVGLRQQGHMDRVASMLAQGSTWDEIGVAIGWHGPTARDWWCRESALLIHKLTATLEASRDRQKAHHRRAQKAEAALLKATNAVTDTDRWSSAERRHEANQRDHAMDAVGRAADRELIAGLADPERTVAVEHPSRPRPHAPITRSATRNWRRPIHQLREQLASGWRDPDTEPPPPGVPVIAFFINPCGMTRRVRAEYAEKHSLELSDEAEGGCTCGEDGCGEDVKWCAAGWYESNEFEEIHWRVDEEVLLWHPLPELPEKYRNAEAQA